MLKTATAVATAAIVAAGFVLFPSLSPQVEAHSTLVAGKSDRLDTRPLGSKCSQRAWPYYEPACLRDARNPLGQARAVRIVSTDRF